MTRRSVLILILLLSAADGGAAASDDRLVRIILLWPSRDFDTIRARLDDARTVYRESGDPRREATAQLLLGLATIGRDAQKARLHFGEAGAGLEEAGDFVGAALAYWLFAEHEQLLERQSDHVRALFETSLAHLERAKSPSALFSIDTLLIVGPVAGLPPAEYEPTAERPEVDRVRVLQLLEVFIRTGYGAEFLRIGDVDNADAELLLAKEAALSFAGRIDAPIDHHLGNLRRRQWRLDEARASYDKALENLKVLRPIGLFPPKRLKVEVFGDLAELEMLEGRIDDALAWSDRALELVRAENSPETEAVVLNRRAETLVRGGRFAAAEKAFVDALALAEREDALDLQVSILLSRANMNRRRGRYGAAAAHLEKALEVLARSDQLFREPAILGNLAMNYVLLDADDTARLLLQKARQAAEQSGRRLDVATIDLIESTRKHLSDETSLDDFRIAIEQWSRTPDALSVPGAEHLAQLLAAIMGSAPVDPQLPVRTGMLSDGTVELLQAGVLFSEGRELPRARELAMKSLEVMANAKHRAGALAMIGGTYVAEGDDEKGIAYFTKALDALDMATEDARVDPFLSDSPAAAEWSAAAFDVLLQLLAKHGRHAEAFAVSERVRARVFLQMIGNNRVTPRGAGNTLPAREAETLRTQILQWQQQGRLEATRQTDDDVRQARRRYEALMTRAKAANPEYAAMTSVEPLQLDAIREALPPDTTLVNYFVTPNAAHAWVLDRERLHYVALPFGPNAVARAECAAKQFGVGGRGVRPLHAPCEPATVEELYGRLVAPLRAHLHNPRLLIVPHGVLHYLPFVALRDPRTARHLIEDYTITYAPSASSLPFLRAKETPVKGKALVIGAPAGVSPDLPGAMREAIAVAKALQTVPVTGRAARESLLYRLNADVDLVHIAAHGFFERDAPLFSRLALAAGDGYDGNLEVHEILSEVDLQGVNLVVLSACQTGVGKGNAGDDIVGLTRALLYAGTPGVISTLWDIGDEATATLMDHFYSRLLGGDSVADALRYAQLRLLHGDHPDPRHWAAFTLHGDPGGRWSASDAN